MADNIPTAYKKSFNLDRNLGKGRYYRDLGMERSSEAKRFNLELTSAENARRVEDERKSLLSFLGAGLGFAIGGPTGMAIGYGLGKGGGGAMTYGGRPVEDYKVGTDPGKFDVSQEYEFEEVNRDLAAADKADFYSDIYDIGKVASLAWTMGGGSFTDPGNFTPWQLGGKTASSEFSGYGPGLFRTQEVIGVLEQVLFGENGEVLAKMRI